MEIADVFTYLVNLADKYKMDMIKSAFDKIKLNKKNTLLKSQG